MEKISKISKLINRFYHKIFIENFNGKINFNFDDNFFRWDLIDYLIKKNNYNDYLEIGCDNDQLFSRININNKVGVDPFKGGTIRKTSNEFFLENTKFFDIIFIDGLHIYKQAKKDILNSVKVLNDDGIILVHDCLPDSIGKQAVPRYKMQWNGDVWKSIVDLRQDENLEIFTCKIDQGIGVIKKKNNSSVLKLEKSIEELRFKDFFNNYDRYMRVITLSEFKNLF